MYHPSIPFDLLYYLCVSDSQEWLQNADSLELCSFSQSVGLKLPLLAKRAEIQVFLRPYAFFYKRLTDLTIEQSLNEVQNWVRPCSQAKTQLNQFNHLSWCGLGYLFRELVDWVYNPETKEESILQELRQRNIQILEEDFKGNRSRFDMLRIKLLTYAILIGKVLEPGTLSSPSRNLSNKTKMRKTTRKNKAEYKYKRLFVKSSAYSPFAMSSSEPSSSGRVSLSCSENIVFDDNKTWNLFESNKQEDEVVGKILSELKQMKGVERTNGKRKRGNGYEEVKEDKKGGKKRRGVNGEEICCNQEDEMEREKAAMIIVSLFSSAVVVSN
eukprot:TRINITY_DN2862_c0_g1_i1.p1 TRINITY_DN2862_c0_g1~~TRINITY_DN2862_c0_g1_i1.p1  ORF type:complete len:327 (-),score=89.41 TRINITY_DN2862_c0_g1_i1:37-1017(-)